MCKEKNAYFVFPIHKSLGGWGVDKKGIKTEEKKSQKHFFNLYN